MLVVLRAPRRLLPRRLGASEAIQMLQADPQSAPMFDQIFGQGAAARVLGAASPQQPSAQPGGPEE